MRILNPIDSPNRPIAFIENNWPRPGFLEDGVGGEGYLGRFLGHGGQWCFEDATGLVARSGKGELLTALDAILRQKAVVEPNVGAIGFAGYEAGYTMVGLKRPIHAFDPFGQIPDLQFLFFKSLRPIPRQSTGDALRARGYTRHQLDRLVERPEVQTQISPVQYQSDVETIRERIAAGDIYQANYTQAFHLSSIEPIQVQYQRLVAACPAPYSALLQFPKWTNPGAVSEVEGFPAMTIFGASPERLLRKTGNRIETRPIKGTIGRACSPDDDQRARRQLIQSKKDRAELLMITDLERNDLGKVARIGSVRVESLARLRRAPSVWHLESTVVADASPNITWADALCALFPGGSITGAPKRRAMEIIASLEAKPRGVYCGAYGWVDAHGDCDFAVAIRTAVRIHDSIRLSGGGGIVYDSHPESEYYESIIKIAPMLEAFAGEVLPSTCLSSTMTVETEEAHA